MRLIKCGVLRLTFGLGFSSVASLCRNSLVDRTSDGASLCFVLPKKNAAAMLYLSYQLEYADSSVCVFIYYGGVCLVLSRPSRAALGCMLFVSVGCFAFKLALQGSKSKQQPH